MAPPETVEVAHNADTVLVCGAEDRKIININTSSTILSHGSKVFKSMLSPQFREGGTLSAQSKVSIPLPEDDPDAMVILCKALHMRFDMRAEEISAETLLKIGVVADKYDCSLGLGVLPHYWINQQMPTANDKTRAQLFVASYLLKEPEMFQRLGYELQMKNAGKVVIVLQEEHQPHVLGKAIDTMNDARVGFIRVATRIIEDSMQGEVDGYKRDSVACSPNCKYMGSRGRAFIRQLRDSEVSPLHSLAARPIAEICTTLRDFPKWEQSEVPIRSCGRNAACFDNFHNHSVESVMADFKYVAGLIESYARRPCFDCLTEGCWDGRAKCEKGHRVWI